MRVCRLTPWLLGASAILLGTTCARPQAPQNALTVEARVNSETIPRYDVFEVTFRHDHDYTDPFHDVTIEATLTAPGGQTYAVGGFFYGSSEPPDIRASEPDARGRRNVQYIYAKRDVWKARFAPGEVGAWTYSYTFANAAGERTTGEGAFTCVQGRAPNRGFLRQDPRNPYRWVYEDGSPYYPIGLQDCWGDGEGSGSALATCSMEGPYRTDRQNRPELPPGAIFRSGPSMNPQNGDVYFRTFGQCGFNLYRFSQQNCSYVLYDDLDHYLIQQGIMTDELVRTARKYGFRFMYGLFGYQKAFTDTPEDAAGMEKVKRFVKYSVDRWGAYVDIWEFLNEQKAADGWYAAMIPYLQSIDPYHHPITTSWERPELTGIEVNAPHWYDGYSNGLDCDARTAGNAGNWKQQGKPVIVGEQGNHASKEQLQEPGVGGTWDPGSPLRMRLRNWAAFFCEIGFIFWNTSYARDGHFMNIWLGPQERQYVRAMQGFAEALGPDLHMAEVAVSRPQEARAYGLASADRAGAYLHHFTDHHSPLADLQVTLDVPATGRAYWYSTETAAILGVADAPAGRQTFAAPAFEQDLALLITPGGPPDIDRDGRSNDVDDDDDSDGVADAEDAFPLDPSEWADADGDLIGDNQDADDDANGIGDDRNGNGIEDWQELDFDGDGIDRAKVVPWDVFPLDPKESRDTDGDGIGDSADPDRDGDGYGNAEEQLAGTDPLDRLSFPPQ